MWRQITKSHGRVGRDREVEEVERAAFGGSFDSTKAELVVHEEEREGVESNLKQVRHKRDGNHHQDAGS